MEVLVGARPLSVQSPSVRRHCKHNQISNRAERSTAPSVELVGRMRDTAGHGLSASRCLMSADSLHDVPGPGEHHRQKKEVHKDAGSVFTVLPKGSEAVDPSRRQQRFGRTC